MNISRQGAIEMLEFVNDGTIRGKAVTDPKALRFREKLRAAFAAIASGDHLSARQIDLFEEIAVNHLKFQPYAYDRETLHWVYTPRAPSVSGDPNRKNRAPIYSHDVLEV